MTIVAERGFSKVRASLNKSFGGDAIQKVGHHQHLQSLLNLPRERQKIESN